ncbi:MAG: hypothetical protein F6K26_32870 [Moorea sp. SIO2I5]|nr:hypothetical protein [Moorena sp. SIO2I5]
MPLAYPYPNTFSADPTYPLNNSMAILSLCHQLISFLLALGRRFSNEPAPKALTKANVPQAALGSGTV